MKATLRVLLCGLWMIPVHCGNGAPQPAGTESEPAAETPAEPKDPREDRVRIPAGDFVYGATSDQVGVYISRSLMNFPGMVEAIRATFVTPPRTETLPEFYIDPFEVTNSEFAEFLQSSGYQPGEGGGFLSHWSGTSPPDWAESFPVVWVSQQDADSYCRWTGGRLPTEEEWEKAARGPDGRAFPWGNTFPSADTANFGRQQAEPAGNRPGDVSPYEVYDLAGNVAELTASTATFSGAPRIVTRGGSYADAARETMAAYRDLSATASTRRENVGFRCVAD